MPDKITKLCTRLVAEDDPREFRPVAVQLQRAIRERLESVRESAIPVVLVDKIINWQGFFTERHQGERHVSRAPRHG